MMETWVLVGPDGLEYVGLHYADINAEADVWRVYFGWPSDEEIAAHKRAGYYAAKARITWERPE